MNEQLPDGLQLAVKVLLEESARNELIGAPESWNEELGVAIDAIRAEHAQRLTLQHHACDLAQRVADLEAENAKFRQWLEESNGRAEDYAGRVLKLDDECDELKEERNALRARLAEVDAQEPAAVIGSGYRIHYVGAEPISAVVARHGLKVGSALYARPVPAQAVPDGWRLVPVEPTPEMERAGDRWTTFPLTTWMDMVEAAPEYKA